MTKRNEDGNPHPCRWMPGTWRALQSAIRGFYYVVSKDSLCRLAVMFGLENDKYNAHLMAAAPELYAMLAEILDNAVVNYVYREKAEKIMAKARGETVE